MRMSELFVAKNLEDFSKIMICPNGQGSSFVQTSFNSYFICTKQNECIQYTAEIEIQK